jgi:hypothetical protein
LAVLFDARADVSGAQQLGPATMVANVADVGPPQSEAQRFGKILEYVGSILAMKLWLPLLLNILLLPRGKRQETGA